MAGIGLCKWLCAFRNSGSGESGNAFLGFEHSWVKAEKAGKVVVDLDQARGADRGGVEAGEKALWQARVRIVKRNVHRACGSERVFKGHLGASEGQRVGGGA